MQVVLCAQLTNQIAFSEQFFISVNRVVSYTNSLLIRQVKFVDGHGSDLKGGCKYQGLILNEKMLSCCQHIGSTV